MQFKVHNSDAEYFIEVYKRSHDPARPVSLLMRNMTTEETVLVFLPDDDTATLVQALLFPEAL